jgi:hypothetical protein
MPQQAWSDQRERQYEHIKDGLLERGESEVEGRSKMNKAQLERAVGR